MSIEYCEKCDEHIDTDFNAEHFDEEVNGCETTYQEEAIKLFEDTFGLKKSPLTELKEMVADLHKPFAGFIEIEQARQEKAQDHALAEKI